MVAHAGLRAQGTVFPDGTGKVRLGADVNTVLPLGDGIKVDTYEDGTIHRIKIFDPSLTTASGFNARSSILDLARDKAAEIVFTADALVFVEADGVRFYIFPIPDRDKLQELKYNISVSPSGSIPRYNLSEFVADHCKGPDAEKNTAALGKVRSMYICIENGVQPKGFAKAVTVREEKSVKDSVRLITFNVKSRDFYEITPGGIGPVTIDRKVTELTESYRYLYDVPALQTGYALEFDQTETEAQDFLKRRIMASRTARLIDKRTKETVRTTRAKAEVFALYDLGDDGTVIPRFEVLGQRAHIDSLLQGKVFDIESDSKGRIKRIKFYDPRFKTPSGLDANSSLWDLYQQPDAEIVYTVDGNMHVEADGVSFYGFIMSGDMGWSDEIVGKMKAEGKKELRFKVSDVWKEITKDSAEFSDTDWSMILSSMKINIALYIEIAAGVKPAGYTKYTKLIEEKIRRALYGPTVQKRTELDFYVDINEIERITGKTSYRKHVDYSTLIEHSGKDVFWDMAFRVLVPEAGPEKDNGGGDGIIEFADSGFKSLIVRDSKWIDANGDKEISTKEALKVRNLNIKDGNHFINMKSTADLSHFGNLEKLEILADVEYEGDKVTYYSTADALDVSSLGKLQDVSCHLPLNRLSLGRKFELGTLNFTVSPLGMMELDLSGCPALRTVFIKLTGKPIRSIYINKAQKQGLAPMLQGFCEELVIQ